MLIVVFYFIVDVLIILVGTVQYNLQLVKTGLDMSALARYIIPDKYQIVSERAEMEQENSKGVLIYYKDENGNILMRERRMLSPGYHVIKPPENCGEREYYLMSENRVTIDNNGHGTPNILHFYYKYSELSFDEQEKQEDSAKQTSNNSINDRSNTYKNTTRLAVTPRSTANNKNEPERGPQGQLKIGRVRVQGENKSVRQNAGEEYDRVAKVSYPENFPCYDRKIGTSGRWWYLIWVDSYGTFGWISEGVSMFY